MHVGVDIMKRFIIMKAGIAPALCYEEENNVYINILTHGGKRVKGRFASIHTLQELIKSLSVGTQIITDPEEIERMLMMEELIS